MPGIFVSKRSLNLDKTLGGRFYPPVSPEALRHGRTTQCDQQVGPRLFPPSLGRAEGDPDLTIRSLPGLFHCRIELELDLLKPDAKLGEPAGRPIVFAVDDDVAVREGLSGLFRSVRWRVETFASAAEFLRRKPPADPSCLCSMSGCQG